MMVRTRRFCAVCARGGRQTRCPSCPARLRCQCRTHGKLRSLVRTGERSAPAVQCASGAWSRGAFTYWMCGEGGHCAERCATTRVVSQGNTCATNGHIQARTGERGAPVVQCAIGVWSRGSIYILDVRGGRSLRGALCHYACGKPRQHTRATNGRVQARTGERGAPALDHR